MPLNYSSNRALLYALMGYFFPPPSPSFELTYFYGGMKETWQPEETKSGRKGGGGGAREREHNLSLVFFFFFEREVGSIGIHSGPSILDLVRHLAAANCSSDTCTSPPHTVSKRATVLIGLNCVRDGRGKLMHGCKQARMNHICQLYEIKEDVQCMCL